MIENAAGSSFEGGIIVGDPPPAEHATAAHSAAAVTHTELADATQAHLAANDHVAFSFDASHHLAALHHDAWV